MPAISWLKSVILDIACTAVIAVAVLVEPAWARWFVIIYTPFMLLMKVAALSVSRGTIKRSRAGKARQVEAPAAFFHVIYGINLALFVLGRWWIMVAAWAAIWALSVSYARRVGSVA
jgi:hypothetical protein